MTGPINFREPGSPVDQTGALQGARSGPVTLPKASPPPPREGGDRFSQPKAEESPFTYSTLEEGGVQQATKVLDGLKKYKTATEKKLKNSSSSAAVKELRTKVVSVLGEVIPGLEEKIKAGTITANDILSVIKKLQALEKEIIDDGFSATTIGGERDEDGRLVKGGKPGLIQGLQAAVTPVEVQLNGKELEAAKRLAERLREYGASRKYYASSSSSTAVKDLRLKVAADVEKMLEVFDAKVKSGKVTSTDLRTLTAAIKMLEGEVESRGFKATALGGEKDDNGKLVEGGKTGYVQDFQDLGKVVVARAGSANAAEALNLKPSPSGSGYLTADGQPVEVIAGSDKPFMVFMTGADEIQVSTDGKNKTKPNKEQILAMAESYKQVDEKDRTKEMKLIIAFAGDIEGKDYKGTFNLQNPSKTYQGKWSAQYEENGMKAVWNYKHSEDSGQVAKESEYEYSYYASGKHATTRETTYRSNGDKTEINVSYAEDGTKKNTQRISQSGDDKTEVSIVFDGEGKMLSTETKWYENDRLSSSRTSDANDVVRKREYFSEPRNGNKGSYRAHEYDEEGNSVKYVSVNYRGDKPSYRYTSLNDGKETIAERWDDKGKHTKEHITLAETPEGRVRTSKSYEGDKLLSTYVTTTKEEGNTTYENSVKTVGGKTKYTVAVVRTKSDDGLKTTYKSTRKENGKTSVYESSTTYAEFGEKKTRRMVASTSKSDGKLTSAYTYKYDDDGAKTQQVYKKYKKGVSDGSVVTEYGGVKTNYGTYPKKSEKQYDAAGKLTAVITFDPKGIKLTERDVAHKMVKHFDSKGKFTYATPVSGGGVYMHTRDHKGYFNITDAAAFKENVVTLDQYNHIMQVAKDKGISFPQSFMTSIASHKTLLTRIQAKINELEYRYNDPSIESGKKLKINVDAPASIYSKTFVDLKPSEILGRLAILEKEMSKYPPELFYGKELTINMAETIYDKTGDHHTVAGVQSGKNVYLTGVSWEFDHELYHYLDENHNNGYSDNNDEWTGYYAKRGGYPGSKSYTGYSDYNPNPSKGFPRSYSYSTIDEHQATIAEQLMNPGSLKGSKLPRSGISEELRNHVIAEYSKWSGGKMDKGYFEYISTRPGTPWKGYVVDVLLKRGR